MLRRVVGSGSRPGSDGGSSASRSPTTGGGSSSKRSALPALIAAAACSLVLASVLLWPPDALLPPSRLAARLQARARAAQAAACREQQPLSVAGTVRMRVEVPLDWRTNASFWLHLYQGNDVVSNAIADGGWEPALLYQVWARADAWACMGHAHAAMPPGS